LTIQLYDRQETDVALGALAALSRDLPEPFLLIGGWAVYLTVIESYQKEHGVPYLGSRDIDLGFHIDITCDDATLQNCTYSKALDVLMKEGYMPQGSFRYCKIIRRDTGEVLDEKQAIKLNLYEVFYLYVDMMVDNIHPKHREFFKVEPMDEPFISRVFDEGCGMPESINGARVIIPPPHILLATKMKAIPDRTKDDKLLKDACDIYAIIWHSRAKYRDVISMARKEYPEYCKRALKVITGDVAVKAAYHLGVDQDTYIGVIEQLRV
jgi:hypothetical protein